MLFFLGLVLGAVYVLGAIAVARTKAYEELDRLNYPPYDVYDYAQAGFWGLIIGAIWPVLVFGGAFFAVVGWLLTRWYRP